MARKSVISLGLLLMLTAMPVIAADEQKDGKKKDSGTSHEVDYYTFMEQSNGVTIMVYSYLAHWRWDDKYFPIYFAVGVEHRKENMILTLGDFVVIDAGGDYYTPATYKTILAEYPRLPADKNFLRQRPMNVGNHFEIYSLLSSNFYPVDGGPRLRTNTVSLPSFTWYHDTIYFPHPQAGLEGILTFRVEDPSISSPIEVRFKVPPEKEHKDHGEKDH